MNSIETGWPAFPTEHTDTSGLYDGMTLRDYFAAAFVSSGHVFVELSAGNTPEEVAKQSYALADAMLKARKEL